MIFVFTMGEFTVGSNFKLVAFYIDPREQKFPRILTKATIISDTIQWLSSSKWL